MLGNIIGLTEHEPTSNATWACQMDQIASQNILNIGHKYSSLPAEPQVRGQNEAKRAKEVEH